jgi:enterobactin synthetase component D
VDAIQTLPTHALDVAGADGLPALRAATRGLLPAGDGKPMPVQLLAFDDARFTAAAFAAWRIACPDSVARSVRKRQAEYFFGRLAARRALAEAGLAGAQFDIAIGASREPCWPPGVIGSISHTRRLAAAVALPHGVHQGMGIDLEQIVDAQGRAALLNAVVDATELALLQSLTGGADLDAWLTVVFSAKESLFKGAFAAVGRYFDFSAARVVAIDPVAGRLQLRLAQTLCPQFTAGQERDIGFRRLDADTVITHFVW